MAIAASSIRQGPPPRSASDPRDSRRPAFFLDVSCRNSFGVIENSARNRFLRVATEANPLAAAIISIVEYSLWINSSRHASIASW